MNMKGYLNQLNVNDDEQRGQLSGDGIHEGYYCSMLSKITLLIDFEHKKAC